MDVFCLLNFGIVGCSGVFIDFAITILCKEKLKWNKYFSSMAGFTFAVTNNYILNRHFTFQSTENNIAFQFFKFSIISIIGLMLSISLLYLLQKNTSINYYVSKIIVIAIVFFWNFGANNFYTF